MSYLIKIFLAILIVFPISNGKGTMLSINKNINYNAPMAPTEFHKVDCYWWDDGTKRPCILFIHGGGWQTGAKELHSADALYVSQKHQMNAFTMNYEIGPNNTFPANVEDIKDMVDWLKAAECCDSDNIYLVGLSAGGHLAMWHAMVNKDVKAVLNISGPIAFGNEAPGIIQSADDSRGTHSIEEFSPKTYINLVNMPYPMVWDIRGSYDTIVIDSQSFRDVMQFLPDRSRQIITQDQHTIQPTSPSRYVEIIDQFIVEAKK